MRCICCNTQLTHRQSKYCSNACQRDYQYKEYIIRWQTGRENGIRGLSTQNISQHVRRYLEEKYANKCVLCGWHEVNPITGKSPLEIDHIDGNAENNHEDNLRLICPNCHALTPNFRNLNKGRGRGWRRSKYTKIIPS